MSPDIQPPEPPQPTPPPASNPRPQLVTYGPMATAPELKGAPKVTEPAAAPAKPAPASAPAADAPQEPTPPQPPMVRPVRAQAVDTELDRAVDDISRHDSDEVLTAEDEAAQRPLVVKPSRFDRFKEGVADLWYDRRKRFAILGGLVVVIAALFVWPFTRYSLLGLVLKGPVVVTVVDAKTGQPVSGAVVQAGDTKSQTEANGVAKLSVHLGQRTFAVSKQYYRGSNAKKLVSFSAASNRIKVPIVALGRKVEVKLVDAISGQPVGGATIALGSSKTKAAATGLATVVVNASAANSAATVSLNGYNTATITLHPGQAIAQNTFKLTPSGKLYFLSNLSGTIDVVKTNLDGSGRKTVLAGTGNEDPSTTALLASPDWKYVALLAKRSVGSANLYLIDTTANDKLTTIDSTDAAYTPVGWSGDTFVYMATKNGVNDWQSGQQVLKSYSTSSNQTVLLDQTQASGSNSTDYLKQTVSSPYIVGDQVAYAKEWVAGYAAGSQLSGKQAEYDTIGVNGSGHRTLKTFALDGSVQSTGIYVSAKRYKPNEIYIVSQATSPDSFYDYQNGSVSADPNLDDNTFYNTNFPTYLVSPSGNHTFWTEERDGKNSLFVGDDNGDSSRQIAALRSYSPYGWFTDNYLLVAKGASELYIMPAKGGTPLKVTDYYKPPTNFTSGGGYGGA